MILLLATTSGTNAAGLNLIPLPASISRSAGKFELGQDTVLVADAPFDNEARLLAEELRLNRADGADDRRILLTTVGAAGLGEEAYRLEINRQGATIRARTTAGVFYGCQTLRQLVEFNGGSLPFINLDDSPRYAWRGLMLDVSRHFFDRPALLRLLDEMAGYKLNRFHLHLTDDPGWRLELGKYPELTATGARGNYSDTNAPPQFYSPSDIREIVDYAGRRHIVVVPEIDMPGHAGAATRTFPQFDGGTNTFNPVREETYDFLENVLQETMKIFPSPWFHLGGDEVNLSTWNQNPEVSKRLQADGLQDAQQLEAQFVNRMARFIEAQGRTPAGWDEIVAAHPDANAVIFWWRHNKPEMLVQALAEGHPVVLTPRSPCYFDYPQDRAYPATGWKLYNTPEAVYQGPAVPTNIPPGQLKQILGVEGCVWTERIATMPYLEFMIMPRLAALAEMAWTPDGCRDFASFNTRLQPFLQQYQRTGVHYYDAANPSGSLRQAQSATESGSKMSTVGK